MRYLVLAVDYDGTLASHGKVHSDTLAALERVRASGRELVLVSGRHLPDLKNVFPGLDIFDRVVAENGALLYRPGSREEKLLCEAPNQNLLKLLTQRGVPASAGRCIISTWEPHQQSVLGAIRDLGLGLQVIFNKGAVMVLPSGTNKGTGLRAALDELGFSAHNVVGMGDAENDHALLSICECAVAVANALPALKEHADVVTQAENGQGVVELANQLLADDLAVFSPRLVRHSLTLGYRVSESEQPIRLPPYGRSILFAGPSASGKSTAVAGLLEQFGEHGYQFCLIDPEGDYENFGGALTLGSAKEPPDPKAILRALEPATQSIAVNLLGVRVQDRPQFFSSLLPHIQDMRSRRALPHWLIIDEAHHLLPSSWSPASTTVPQALESTVLITVHPDHVSAAALNPVDVVVATGGSPVSSLQSFAGALRLPRPAIGDVELTPGEALVWFRKEKGSVPVRVRMVVGRSERRRHLRQYAEGELSPPQSFYFRGPERKLNLRAHNLITFLQLADGVDDDTWLYHLQAGHYSEWFRRIIKDEELAGKTEGIEHEPNVSAHESRRRIRDAIEARYTAPA